LRKKFFDLLFIYGARRREDRL